MTMESEGAIVLATMQSFLQWLPTFIIILTNKFKIVINFGKWVFIVPMILGVLGFLFAYFAYGEITIWVAIASGLNAGLSAIVSYDAVSSKYKEKETE